MSDKMREEFEEWASTHEIRCAWDVWRASREAVVVELPHIGDYLDTYRQGENCRSFLDDLRTAIESQGLKVKP